MSNLEEYECLKNIYSRMIMLTAISPIAVLFFGPFLLLYILIPNLYIYSKYYKRDGESTFELHISEMLKKCVTSMTIVIVSFLPLLSMVFINYQKAETGSAYLMLMFSMVSILAGLLISWFYYLYNIVKASKNIDKSMFTDIKRGLNEK
jgi:hypothetical protein